MKNFLIKEMDGRALEHFELLTIAEKDEQYYKQWVGDDIQEIAQQCLGVRRWIRFRHAITVLSRLGYFAIPLLANKPTPGEEFCEAQVSPDVSLTRRLLAIWLNNELQLPPEIPRFYAKLVKDLHLVTFFLFGDFYELAKRFTQCYYITGDTTLYQGPKVNYLNKLIGCLSLAQILINTLTHPMEEQLDYNQRDRRPIVSQAIKNQDESNEETQTDTKKQIDPNMICHLCSEPRKDPTSVLCGHIFCWYCIHKWLKERPECPICRLPTEPSRLVYLINFK